MSEINGEQYTTAAEDLALLRVREAFMRAVHQEIQRAILFHTGGNVCVDGRVVVPYFGLCYALGRAREYDAKRISGLEKSRLEELVRRACDLLSAKVLACLQEITASQTLLDISDLYELLNQAYYMGREDGAA